MLFGLFGWLLSATLCCSSEDARWGSLDLTKCDLPKLVQLSNLEQPALLSANSEQMLVGLSEFEALISDMSLPMRDEASIATRGGHFNTTLHATIPTFLSSSKLFFETAQDSEVHQRITSSWSPEMFAINATDDRQIARRAWPGTPVVSAGGLSAGLPLHRHQEAWLRLLAGRKLWFLRSYEDEEPSTAERVRAGPAALVGDYLQCTQEAGETLFVPAGWWHTTYNLDDFVLGVGGQGFVSLLEALAARGDVSGLRQAMAERKVEVGLLARAAAGSRQLSVLEYLTDIGEADVRRSGAIHSAAGQGHTTILSWMLSRFGSSLAKSTEQPTHPHGTQPMHLATESGMLAAAQLLAAHGASVRISDTTGRTPLHGAAANGDTEVVRWLLRQGALPTAAWMACVGSPTQVCGGTPGHFGVLAGHLDVVKLLVDHGYTLESQDANGQTLCHVAAAGGQVEILMWLLDAGAISDSHDHQGNTPLGIAVGRKNDLMVDFLKSRGVIESGEL